MMNIMDFMHHRTTVGINKIEPTVGEIGLKIHLVDQQRETCLGIDHQLAADLMHLRHFQGAFGRLLRLQSTQSCLSTQFQARLITTIKQIKIGLAVQMQRQLLTPQWHPLMALLIEQMAIALLIHTGFLQLQLLCWILQTQQRPILA